MPQTFCSKCGHDKEAGRERQRYCLACHAAYMREWRKTHKLSDEARRRANARVYANTYMRRGHIERGSCAACDKPGEEMHHDDYDKPLEVTWLCRPCHVAQTVSENRETSATPATR